MKAWMKLGCLLVLCLLTFGYAPRAGRADTPARQILIYAPAKGAAVRSPVQVTGWVSVAPFESTLLGRVYDAAGKMAGSGPIMVETEMGQPGAFRGTIAFSAGRSGPGRVEIAEISPKDGSVVVSSSVDVLLTAGAASASIRVPKAGASVTLPLRILAEVGTPGQAVSASLRWEDGTVVEQRFTTLRGADGKGLLIETLNWPNEGQPPVPPTQAATLELRDGAGRLLASQGIRVLSPTDPNTRAIRVHLLLGETVAPVVRRIPKTPRIGAAALEELLWGPWPPNLAGFGTALPTPEDVLSYPGREPDWGPRVTLRKLTIVNGVARADFSQELRAYGGGSLRVTLIRQQIEQTLKQFSSVKRVVISIEGETEGVLEP